MLSDKSFEALLTVDCTKISGSIAKSLNGEIKKIKKKANNFFFH